MSLFQSSVLKKYLSSQDHDRIQEEYEVYKAYFHNETHQRNIRASKEEQFQQKFLIELFVNIFGYRMNPDEGFNMTTELKNIGDTKKTDGAILKGDNALAVIELKGTNTRDLSKVTEQAFNYKNNQPSCVYVITSNFEKLRFYIHSAVDYEEFNLFSLSQERFSLLWLLLHKDNLLKGLPEKIKSESLLEEEKVTKRLYKDYSEFKNDLWEDMCRNNPKEDELVLYKKSQKLLDRFLFIFFAEDKGLLPPNSISVIVEQWNKLKELDEYKPLYGRFQKYFGYMNDGYKGAKYEIHAYNGGLFKTDELLDGLTIDDELLRKHCLKLSEYDFDSEVDTNILGHIFEHSLNDIENVRAQLVGEEIDKSKTKRKKDGVFYTPKYITKYIVDNTVGKLCREKKTEIGIDDEEFAKDRKGRRTETLKRLDEQLKQYREWLLQLTICDPACGSGAFLNQTLDFLIAEHHYVDELESQLLGYAMVFPDVENHILERNIFGVDINEESVEIARLSLWLRTAKKGRKLNSLSNNIKVGNSLIDKPEIAGELAFNWQAQFPIVFEKGGFDVLIGNPPYGASLSSRDKQYLTEKFPNSTTGKIDTYRIFIENAVELSCSNGLISYIVPNTFLYNVQSYALRNFLLNTVTIYDAVELRKNIFEDAPDVVPVITSLKNSPSASYSFRSRVAFHNVNYYDIYNDPWEIDQIIPFEFLRNDKALKINLRSNVQFASINDKLSSFSELGLHFNLRQGTKPYGSKSNKSIELIGDKPLGHDWEPAINGRNISRYHIDFDEEYVHRCSHLHSVIDKQIIEGEKIYFQRMRKISLFPRIVASYDSGIYHGLYTCSVITRKESSDLDLKYALAILNSKLINVWYKYFDTDVEIKLTSVKQVPIPQISSFDQQRFIAQIDKMLSDSAAYQTLRKNFISLLQSKHPIDKPSKKLQNWSDLDFKEFLLELKKKKIKLGLEEEADWLTYFNKKKTEANVLQAEISRTDKQIDQLVYQLYGLSEKEVAIVENS